MNEDRNHLPDDPFADRDDMGDMDEKFEEALEALESYPDVDEDTAADADVDDEVAAAAPEPADPGPAAEAREPDSAEPAAESSPGDDRDAFDDDFDAATLEDASPAAIAEDAEGYDPDAELADQDWVTAEPDAEDDDMLSAAAATAAVAAEDVLGTGEEAVPAAFGEPERLRQPRRAEIFRRRMRAQFGMLPLALFLVALGLYLIMRQRAVEGLPDFSDAALVVAAVLAVAFTAIFHAFVFGRTERGLLFFGLLVWISAGLVALLVLGIEREPQAAEWWPLALVALGLGFLATFLLERGRDARLVLASVAVWVAAAVAFVYTNGQLDEQLLDDAASYWPLLLSVVGVGLLPLVFRRRTG